jgi:uncharacterized protein involved in copper resistance
MDPRKLIRFPTDLEVAETPAAGPQRGARFAAATPTRSALFAETPSSAAHASPGTRRLHWDPAQPSASEHGRTHTPYLQEHNQGWVGSPIDRLCARVVGERADGEYCSEALRV